MEHAYFIIHINKIENKIVGCGIYSEWPLTSLGLETKNVADVCVFHKIADTYAKARNELMKELLSFPMVQFR